MKRVLVVDDDPGATSALRTLLEMDGYDVVALVSSVDAISRLGSERFDAVITDLEMPVVHGIEVVCAAGATPVLVVTAYAGSPVAQRAQDLGASRVLPKPVHYATLLAELKKILGESS